MSVKKSLGSRIAFGAMRLAGAFPLGFHLRMAKFVRWIFKDLLRYRYATVMVNLARSFPKTKYKALEKIADEFYLHFADIIVQAVWFSGCRGAKGCKRFSNSGILECANPEVVNDYYDSGRSVMLLNSHCGNWELVGGILDMKGPITVNAEDVCVVYRKLANPKWDWVFEESRGGIVRHRGFNGYVEAEQVLRYALGRKNTPTLYIFNNDQHPFHNIAKPYSVGNFMNQPTEAMGGALAIARKLAMPVLFLRWDASERGRYKIFFDLITDDASKEEIDLMLRQYYKFLEDNIKAQPFNYLWSHRRWK